jgi:hypothetical protein
VRLLAEKEEVELAIAKLKSHKDQYDEQEYYSKLEQLLVQLAGLNEQIEKIKTP